MKYKSMPATVAPGDAEDGVFEAIVSVFNNKDLVGDVVRPGAFAKTLDYWAKSGDPIPVYWSHRLDDPQYNIGEVLDAKELVPGAGEIPHWTNQWVRENGGLYIKAQLDDYGTGLQVRRLMKQRRVKQFSFSYDVTKEQQTDAGNELQEVFLYEVGPTPLGANPLTELLSAKTSPDPNPPPDDPGPEAKRRPSALFLRHQCDIALWQHQLAD